MAGQGEINLFAGNATAGSSTGLVGTSIVPTYVAEKQCTMEPFVSCLAKIQ